MTTTARNRSKAPGQDPGIDRLTEDLDFLKAKADEVLAAWLARMGGAS